MRVGLVIYGALTTTSGGYRYDRELVRALTAAGHEVDLISLPWRSYGRHLADNISPRLLARLSDGRHDLLLQDELNHPSLVVANRRRSSAGAPIVAIVHHLRSDEAWPRWQRACYRVVERAYLQSVDALLVNSHSTARTVARCLGSDRPTWVAVPGRDQQQSALTPELVRQRAGADGPLRILFVGNVIPRKGLHRLIDGLTELPAGTWQLDVVGSLRVDPAYARAIGMRVARLGPSAAIRLHGALSVAALTEQFVTAQVLAVPSAYEGFGIVYLEGMGFGLPAIAAAAGGATDLVLHGDNGFLVEAGQPRAVATALGRLARDRARLARMSAAALATFDRHPTWDQTMTPAVRFLERFAAGSVTGGTPAALVGTSP